MESRTDTVPNERLRSAEALMHLIKLIAIRSDTDEYATKRFADELDHYIERSMQGWVR